MNSPPTGIMPDTIWLTDTWNSYSVCEQSASRTKRTRSRFDRPVPTISTTNGFEATTNTVLRISRNSFTCTSTLVSTKP